MAYAAAVPTYTRGNIVKGFVCLLPYAPILLPCILEQCAHYVRIAYRNLGPQMAKATNTDSWVHLDSRD